MPASHAVFHISPQVFFFSFPFFFLFFFAICDYCHQTPINIGKLSNFDKLLCPVFYRIMSYISLLCVLFFLFFLVLSVLFRPACLPLCVVKLETASIQAGIFLPY